MPTEQNFFRNTILSLPGEKHILESSSSLRFYHIALTFNAITDISLMLIVNNHFETPVTCQALYVHYSKNSL